MDNKKFNIAIIELFSEIKVTNEKLLELAKAASKENFLTDATKEIISKCVSPFLEVDVIFLEKDIY